MLNEVRRLLRLFSTFGFDGVIMATFEKGRIGLRTFVGCVVLMHYYLHTSQHITTITLEMINRYPMAVNKKVLKVTNETNIQYDLLVASALSNKIKESTALRMASDRDLKKMVDEVMAIYFLV